MANIEEISFSYLFMKSQKSRIDLKSEPGKDSLVLKTFVRKIVMAGQSAAEVTRFLKKHERTCNKTFLNSF